MMQAMESEYVDVVQRTERENERELERRLEMEDEDEEKDGDKVKGKDKEQWNGSDWLERSVKKHNNNIISAPRKMGEKRTTRRGEDVPVEWEAEGKDG
jgi:hypothetical protein